MVSNEYGADCRVSAQTNALGQRGTFAWDPATHTSTYTDANGGQWLDLYAGNALRGQVDPLGNVSSYAYDAAFNLTAVTDPRGHITSWTYDPAGNRTSRTDANGRTTSWAYDAANRLSSVTDAAGEVTGYAYDAVGNLVSRTDANAHVTSYAYVDPAGLAGETAQTRTGLTVGWCIGGGGGAGAYWAVSGCLLFGGGKFAVSGTLAGGAELGVTASVGTGPIWSNASEPADLSGAALTTGGSVGEGLGGGVDTSFRLQVKSQCHLSLGWVHGKDSASSSGSPFWRRWHVG